MKEFLSSNGIEYAYVDITGSMLTLKRFLKLRDNRPEYQDIKASGRVGIPCVEVENRLFFETDSLDIEWIKSN